MDYSKTPLWMQDDLVKDIPREKLDFLSKLFAQGHGKSQKEIAADLHISESTVKWHFGILYTTLNVSGKDEILALFK